MDTMPGIHGTKRYVLKDFNLTNEKKHPRHVQERTRAVTPAVGSFPSTSSDFGKLDCVEI